MSKRSAASPWLLPGQLEMESIGTKKDPRILCSAPDLLLREKHYSVAKK